MILRIISFSITSLVLTYLSVAILIRWAEKRHFLDIPNERSSHFQPTPRGGGLAIVVISLTGIVLSWYLTAGWPLLSLLAFLSGAILISAISWWDDIRSLSNRTRFLTHSFGAVLCMLGFGYWRTFGVPFLGQIHLGFLGLLLTFVWVVGLTNAYNFMDGIDGIAGGQAIVSGVGWAILGWLSDQPSVCIMGLLLGATSLGFLGHNWPTARIFMGDVGSAFLGYTFAFLPIVASQKDPRFILIGVLLVWPFVFDTTFTFFRRLRKGENVFTAHRSHLYQRLVIIGYSHRFVTLLYVGLALVGMILGLSWYMKVNGSDLAISTILPLLCLGLWAFVIRQEHTKIAGIYSCP